ncbi:MAG: hypothetical protein RLO52_22780 [Sandaracinaceae bacterium]|nr:hypothetical protein [Myxococcales bacterium]
MNRRLTPLTVLALLASACSPDPFITGDGGVGPAPMCNAYEYRGTTYDCDALDRCTETDITYRLACCECDPRLCNPDPDCGDAGGPPIPDGPAESCMSCHNGSERNDYAGDGMSNPHPFPGEPNVQCTTCHGGNGRGTGRLGSHVPPPPEIGDDDRLIRDEIAYANRRTLAGIDNFPDYTVDGVTYTALEYLQFINPGDLRVVTSGEGCGTPGCHAGEHAEWVENGPIGNAVGMFSGAAYTAGLENEIPEHRGLWENTAGDYGWRADQDDDWDGPADLVGSIGRVEALPERGQFGTGEIYENPVYNANNFGDYVTAAGDPDGANRIIPNTPLEHTYFEAIGITCGDCHLGSAGQNDRYGDFRSSGCTACHMEYSADGRSRSTDPNVNHFEPADPDAIAAPERAHIDSHQIRNVAKTLPGGAFVRGISDYACAGCHQGSNRTVMQYWGIRLDQNRDVAQGNQYPENPNNFENTANDTRLFDPAVGNNTFNGRDADQYLLVEDYDGDNRDDTPADVHHEAGLGCIDCHGSRDLHGGTRGDDTSGRIMSRMSQGTHIECQSCHGGVSSYAATVPCRTYAGGEAECGIDRLGNPLRHVTREGDDFYLTSRLTGRRHFVVQTRDVVVDNGKVNPFTRQRLYTPMGSYAMGRADGNPATGIGPLQTDPTTYTAGFSHTDRMDCASCHSSWTNNCVGCHLANGYDANPANYFTSNLTGERIVQFQAAADFTYQTPVPFYLGVNARGRITQTQPGIQMFYRYFDLNGNESQVFAFSDRNGNGNNPDVGGRDAHGALSHDAMMPHSIRGRVSGSDEGPRYCVACHMTDNSLATFGAQYDVFRNALANRNYNNLDFNLLRQHIGQNTGNQLDSPIWVHMVAGLGSGIFLFDDTGCPENPLDDNANRAYCPDGAPARTFNANDVVYNLDGLVEANGISNASSSHPALDRERVRGLRIGATNPYTSGPLGADLTQLLADPDVGVVLDSWIDADGAAQGDAADYIE